MNGLLFLFFSCIWGDTRQNFEEIYPKNGWVLLDDLQLYSWTQVLSIPTTFFTQLSMWNDTVGYASAELSVWGTTDGQNWNPLIRDNHYYYGVAAVSGTSVIVSGFTDSGKDQSGWIRWSSDNGNSWSDFIVLTSSKGPWLMQQEWIDEQHGIIYDQSGGTYITVTGG